MSSTTRRTASASTSVAMTSAPSAASCRHTAAPIPEPAPVTRATLPVKPKFIPSFPIVTLDQSSVHDIANHFMHLTRGTDLSINRPQKVAKIASNFNEVPMHHSDSSSQIHNSSADFPAERA